MSSEVPDEMQALRVLSQVIAQFGAARTVAWLAEIVEERSDAFLHAAETQKAAESARAYRILQNAAARLRD